MGKRDLDIGRGVLVFLVLLLIETLVLLLLQLEATERVVRELRSRIEHGGPVWRREDPDFDGARW